MAALGNRPNMADHPAQLSSDRRMRNTDRYALWSKKPTNLPRNMQFVRGLSSLQIVKAVRTAFARHRAPRQQSACPIKVEHAACASKRPAHRPSSRCAMLPPQRAFHSIKASNGHRRMAVNSVTPSGLRWPIRSITIDTPSVSKRMKFTTACRCTSASFKVRISMASEPIVSVSSTLFLTNTCR